MKTDTVSWVLLLQIPLLTVAHPLRSLHRREVPQEHSHEQFLTTTNTFLKKSNPDNIQDAVFGLLGNAAASAGKGNIADPDCLQQATADRAFTNAKAAGDVNGMTAALVYRAVERNTGAVGQASVACTSIKAVNPEIAAISQHQDPASQGAAATNKAITLELAKQIAAIGGDPTVALKSGTFAPGKIGDPTAKGNSCDVQNDPTGCIFTQNLLVEDATVDEINAAVSGAGSAGAQATPAAAAAATPPANNQNAAGQNAPVCSASASNTAAATGNQGSSANSNSAAATGNQGSSANSNTTAAAASQGTSTNSKLDLGTATNPTIVFGAGFDGRKEESFEPADKTEFSHGSADNIKVITGFICQQLQDKFKAPQQTIDTCNQAATAAQAQTGQAAADAFNSGLGF